MNSDLGTRLMAVSTNAPRGSDTMTTRTTRTLDVPGALLTYDVRDGSGGSEPVLLLIGSPMGAAGFGTLSGFFTDRTVVTYDPRGVERSERTDGATRSTPDEHADDLHRLIAALDAGPVDVFASSGGAVNALALVARHPDQVRTLVAHEPPAAQVLPDREHALAASRSVHEAYLRAGLGAGMARFIAIVSHRGSIPADFADQPAPDPATLGLPTEDDGSRDDPLLGQNIVSCTHYEPDLEALRAAPTRIVIGVGAESGGTLAARAAVALAEELGTAPVTFPSHHGGFLGGEYGQAGEPDAFATTLRRVLAEA
jgi:pimeloyl-ACP methyl ester carboxylesterase